jgi:hypothetical protein
MGTKPAKADTILSYLNQLRSSLGNARTPVAPRPLREFYDTRNYAAMVKTVRDGMGLPMRVQVGLVNQGGPEKAPAWVSYPKPLPRLGTEAFKRTLVTVFLRKSFLAASEFESVVMAIAHELSHIVLFGIGHPLEEDEVAVDLTAMLLGYRDFYVAGCHREIRAKSVGQYLARFFRQWLEGVERRAFQTLGYLTPEEVRFAADLLGAPKRQPLVNFYLSNWSRSVRMIGLAGVIIGGLFWFAQPSGSVDSSGKTPPTDASASTEKAPPIGSGNALSAAQIKYCLAEQIRLDGARSSLDQQSATAADRFNAMIDDYNNRCSSYRYKRSDFQRAQSEVEADRVILQAAGRARF